jgi:hypothetical protein
MHPVPAHRGNRQRDGQRPTSVLFAAPFVDEAAEHAFDVAIAEDTRRAG